MNTDKPTSPVDMNPISGVDTNAKNAARRRLLRMGATAGTTALVTLASRPAIACHCVMPSAWGSVVSATGPKDVNQLSTKDGSVYRHKAEKDDFKSWSVSQWKTNGGQAHYALLNFLKSRNPQTTVNKISRLESSGTTVKSVRDAMGLSYTVNQLDVRKQWTNAIGDGSFGALIFQAELNIYSSSNPPTTCGDLPSIVKKMATLSFAPESGDTHTWTEREVRDYLYYNWLAW